MKKILNNRLIAVLIIGILAFHTAACHTTDSAQVQEKASYENFETDYLFANAEFKPNDCAKVVDLSNNYSSISIPENNLVNVKTDNFEEKFGQPRNRKLVFLDTKENILFTISYLYTDKYLEPDIITIDKPYEEQMSDWLDDKGLTWNPNFQYIVTYKESLILIDCTYLNPNMYSAEESAYFQLRTRLFFQEFTDFLSNQENK